MLALWIIAALVQLVALGMTAHRMASGKPATEFDWYDATDAQGQALLASIDRIAAARLSRKWAEPTAIPLRGVPTRAAR